MIYVLNPIQHWFHLRKTVFKYILVLPFFSFGYLFQMMMTTMSVCFTLKQLSSAKDTNKTINCEMQKNELTEMRNSANKHEAKLSTAVPDYQILKRCLILQQNEVYSVQIRRWGQTCGLFSSSVTSGWMWSLCSVLQGHTETDVFSGGHKLSQAVFLSLLCLFCPSQALNLMFVSVSATLSSPSPFVSLFLPLTHIDT